MIHRFENPSTDLPPDHTREGGPVLKSPFPWFGGKSRVSHLVWERFGTVKNYVEPFFGSGAVLLRRPDFDGNQTETVNDLDGFVCNFWRAVQAEPDHVAHWASWPSNHCDLTARNYYLAKKREEFKERLEGDPSYYDPMIAGWWCWGICCWIGGEFALLCGPWSSLEGRLIKLGRKGVKKRPELGNQGKGVQRRLLHLSSKGQGLLGKTASIEAWMNELQVRLERVRVACGNWSGVLGKSVTTKHGITAVFLDPPYKQSDRDKRVYQTDTDPWEDVVEWCIANGDDPKLRIALCGYDGLWGPMLRAAGWIEIAWKTSGGYGAGKGGQGQANSSRERIWFSPHCLKPNEQMEMKI